MNGFRSRYRLGYLRTLVYMLQQSEYNVGDYLDWLHRVHNFSRVERRKRLDSTMAARTFVGFLWLEIAIIGLLIASLDWSLGSNGQGLWALGVTVLVVLALPYLLAYSLAGSVMLARVAVQKPHQRRRIAKAQRALADHPAYKIAVAGSYGKTTMKEILATVLGTTKKVAATPGNMNTPIGISRFVEKLEGNEEVLIFELGEYYPGDIATLSELVRPDLGIITGVNEAHLSKFKSLDATVETIFELGDWLADHPAADAASESPRGPKPRLYVNGESKLATMGAKAYAAELYSRSGVANWKVSHARTGLNGTSFHLAFGKLKIEANSPLLGRHQIGPLAVAAAVAFDLEMSVDDIQAGLAETNPFEHRLEPSTRDGVTTIDDTYNGNPDGARVAIEFLAGLSGHKRYYVTPGLVEMGYRSKDVHEAIGRQLAEAGIEVVVLIENSALPQIKAGLDNSGFTGRLLTYPDEITALVALPKLTTDGDVVLLQNDWPDNYQ